MPCCKVSFRFFFKNAICGDWKRLCWSCDTVRRYTNNLHFCRLFINISCCKCCWLLNQTNAVGLPTRVYILGISWGWNVVLELKKIERGAEFTYLHVVYYWRQSWRRKVWKQPVAFSYCSWNEWKIYENQVRLNDAIYPTISSESPLSTLFIEYWRCR